MTAKEEQYDVVIVGGGVCGSALLYTLSHYTNVKKIALIEKNSAVATVNSKHTSNSQTLHFGDIETNYTLAKAETVNRGASLVKNYLLRHDLGQDIYTRYHKMVLGVGQEQTALLRDRYEQFKSLFPALRLIERAEIEALEPNVLKGRSQAEDTLALFTPDGYAVDFQRLSQSFVKNAVKSAAKDTDKTLSVKLNTKVCAIKAIKASGETIEQAIEDAVEQSVQRSSEQSGEPSSQAQTKGNHYVIELSNGQTLRARAVVVTSGAHSLLFAKSLGYGKDYALLSVAGSFYFAPNFLNGKVYRVQLAKLPFAAIHGDPEVHDASQTRFGPTAKVMPLLERHRYGTLWEYFKTAGLSLSAFQSFFSILSDWTILSYIILNFIYDLPIIGKWLFLRKVREIVPQVKFSDLTFAKGYGGIRPQIVNLKTRQLEMGEAKILGRNILFNITPSPGASTCLKNAQEDTQRLIDFLGEGYQFDTEKFTAELSTSAQVESQV